MKSKTHFKIEYWNGFEATWNLSGLETFVSYDEARAFKEDLAAMTDYTVDFRIVREVA